MGEEPADEAPPPRRARRRAGWWALLIALAVLIAGVAVLWLSRERIAGNVIAGVLDDYGVEATYEIEQIGTRTQILRNVVVGDPQRPDLTIERAIVRINPRLGIPTLGRITLVRPRLYGTYIDGTLSFGALDPLLFRKKEQEPFELPDIDLAIDDGRALLETDFGPVGAKVIGQGNLQDGFAGELGAVSPRLALGGCESGRTSLYGRFEVNAGKPRLAGPLRVDRLRCAASGLTLRDAALDMTLRADERLARIEGDADISLGPSAMARALVAGLRGEGRFTWRDGGLVGRFDLAASGITAAEAAISRLGLTGSVRALRNFERIELGTEIEGQGVRIGSGLDAALAQAAEGSRDTLLAPILQRIRQQLAREGRASTLNGELTLRHGDERTVLVVPNATLRGGSGAALLALSRFQLADGPADAPQFSGNFATGGEGLPRIAGRMEVEDGGGVRVRLAMAEYQAGGSRLAFPELVVVQRPDGALGLGGILRASGALPGGRADNLELPLSGGRSPGGVLSLWPQCTQVRFDGLQYANLTLARQALTLCPQPGAPILRYGPGGLKIAAGAASLRLSGRLGETQLALRSGPIGVAYPGALSIRQAEVTLGPAQTAQRFVISDLSARIGEDISGRFAGTDVHLFSVPLDLLGASGNWRYAGGRLTLSDGSFRLEDRQAVDRFRPLMARGAELSLEDNLITSTAQLREPRTDRVVTGLSLRHDLNTGRGGAQLTVDGLTFDAALQPEALFPAALGIVANTRGVVRGRGRIDWNEAGVTSSGRFSSDSLDFAAAFGPVRGASGTIEFTDLLGLTTAPNQRLRVASINPGIEVTNGEVSIELRGGQVLALRDASWPFMGGTLTMRPVEITFGASEVRRYVLEVTGLDAARFVEYMELNNLSATGVLDGTVPLVFDRIGNGHVEGGLLLTRPPGGNISYVGALTYEDLPAPARLAFDALRSLDYRQMRVQMDGDLTGEIVTRVRFDGVSQGAGATRNFITRAIAGLPIRFDINIRAPFYQLISSTRALYDPAAIKDPRSAEVGLLDREGNAIRRRSENPPPSPIQPEDLVPDEAPIQRRESEEMP